MEYQRKEYMSYMFFTTDEAQPGTELNGRSTGPVHTEVGVVKVTNKWKPDTRIYPTFMHVSGLEVGEEYESGGIVCKRMENGVEFVKVD